MRRILLILALFAPTAFAEPETFETTPSPQRSLGLKLEPGWSKKVVFRSALTAPELPRHFDWREQAQLTTPKDQGVCGSCWTYATVGALESAIAIKDKVQVDLSEQYLLSCNTQGWGCNGGNFAHSMHQNPGAVPESEFPYVGRQVACKQGLSHPYKIDSWAYVPSNSENEPPSVNEIKAAIYQFGPVAAAMGANDAFTGYKSGVFNKCDSTAPNHAIVLTGWDDDGGYWILRNSWSQKWGEQGFAKIKYGCNKVGIASNYIMFKGGVTPPAPGPNPQPQPLPKCTPMPYANAGPNLRVNPGQTVIIGTRAMPYTAYLWEINGRKNPNYNTAQIKAQVFGDAIFTVYATTRCGTARSSAMVVVNRRR